MHLERVLKFEAFVLKILFLGGRVQGRSRSSMLINLKSL